MSEDKTMGILRSQLDRPVMLRYDGQGIKVPARGKTLPLEKGKIEGEIPKGIKFLELRRA
jgi:hypothetical protein